MKRLNVVLAAFLIMTMSLPVRAKADDRIKEGKWKITTTVEGQGSAVIIRCVTNANPIPDIDKYATKFSGCIEPQVHEHGSTVDYHIACSSQAGQITLNGHVVFRGDNMKGKASVQTIYQHKNTKIQTHITGQYMGPC